MKVVLYSTHCPKCNVLKSKLDSKGIDYEEIDDVDLIMNKGYMSVPVLEVDQNVYQFKEANDYINSL